MRVGPNARLRWGIASLGAAAALLAADAAHAGGDGDEDEVLLEFHFNPGPDMQIAIWIEDAAGNFVKDVFVTQSVAKLGIGNRSGIWNFVGSWHAPYGPRKNTLPVWAHRRGKTYPEIIFHDDNPMNFTSLGWHEAFSSAEPYYCRPLKAAENEAILDTMTCPSPNVFQTDKGRFDPEGALSVYPPRSDYNGFEDNSDHPDILEYADINDVDAVSGATPTAGGTFQSIKLDRDEVPEGPLVAWIEVNRELDENPDWDFDREDDHFVDTRLEDYGIEFLGQPSVVYRVEFDPEDEGLSFTDAYHGYGQWDGDDGDIEPPDGTISTADDTGAGRLRMHSAFDESFRWSVYSHGWGSMDEGGICSVTPLPPVEDLVVEATAFDTVRMEFTLPESVPEGVILGKIRTYRWLQPKDEADAEPSFDTATEATQPDFCSEGEVDCIDPIPGERISVEISSLFGNYDTTVFVTYTDICSNQAEPVSAETTTPPQPFQTLEGSCFVATAAYGASWVDRVADLRHFRDAILNRSIIGRDLVTFYYTHGPGLAGLIRKSAASRTVVRTFLEPITDLAGAVVRPL